MKYLLSLVLGVFLSAHSVIANTQPYTSDEVKAALLGQIIKHLQWPNEETQSELSIAVWRDEQLVKAFSPLNGVSIRSKAVRVSEVQVLELLSEHDLVYVSQSRLADLSAIAYATRGKGVLVVTEESQSLHNLMINILIKQTNDASNLEFQINRPNIVFENINISPELVLFGGSEIDVAELYHQTEEAINRLQKQNQDSFAQLQHNRQELKARERDYQQLLQQRQALRQDLQQKQNSILENEKTLLALRSDIKLVETEHADALALLASKEKALADYENNVLGQQRVLRDLETEIAENKQLLSRQKKALSAAQTEVQYQSELITKQRDVIFAVLVVISLILISSAVIVALFVRNKRIKNKLESTLDKLTDAQQHLVESEKMASLGQLVTGVAHEINTPIGVSLTAISTLGAEASQFRHQLDTGVLKKSDAVSFTDKIEKLDELIVGNLQRCHRLVESFKQVSADQIVEQTREVYLGDYCQNIMSTLSALLTQHHIEWFISGDNPKHTIDPGLLHQVINNLISNAVSHAFAGVTDKSIQVHIASHSTYSVLTLSDNGIGMDTDTRQRVFDPFFTTKRSEGGTGLGLNIAYTIVTSKLNGQISVDSEVGRGTTFKIQLPA